MQPEGSEPNKVNYCKHDAQRAALVEIVVDPISAVGREALSLFAANKVGEHHLSPKLTKVGDKSAEDNDAENEHILRSELHFFGKILAVVAVGAASLAVLNRQHKRVNDVHQKSGGEYHRAGNGTRMYRRGRGNSGAAQYDP